MTYMYQMDQIDIGHKIFIDPYMAVPALQHSDPFSSDKVRVIFKLLIQNLSIPIQKKICLRLQTP